MKLHLRNTVLLVALFVGFCLTSCSQKDTKIEKHPDFSKNIIDIRSNIKDWSTHLLLGQSQLKIVGDYLLVCDVFSTDEGFHFYNKRTLEYIGSGGRKGQGPGEIIKYKNVRIIPNENDNTIFFAFDYSKVLLYRYTIDSLLNHKPYFPREICNFKIHSILNNFIVLNDTTFIGLGSYATSPSSFIDGIIKLNIKANKMEAFGYQHPKIKEFGGRNTHSFFTGSVNKNRYIQAYLSHDLMTICDIEGNLISNVYGSKWDNSKKTKFDIDYFNDVELCRDYIIAAYNGGNGYTVENNTPRGTCAQKFLVFDLDGNYLKTFDVGEEIKFFCIDEDTNRLFLALRDRDVLSYVDLNGLLD